MSRTRVPRSTPVVEEARLRAQWIAFEGGRGSHTLGDATAGNLRHHVEHHAPNRVAWGASRGARRPGGGRAKRERGTRLVPSSRQSKVLALRYALVSKFEYICDGFGWRYREKAKAKGPYTALKSL